MADYHADREHVSRSDLATFDFSRRLFKRRRDGESEPERDELRIGKGTHAIALRDTLEIQKIKEIPSTVLSVKGARQGNAFTTFRLKNRGKLLLLPKQYELCQAIAQSFDEVEVAETSEGAPITVGDLVKDPRSLKEWEHRWKEILPCRMKADLVFPIGDPERPSQVICLDLKTARSRDRRAFKHEVLNRKLWLQDAHYSAGLADKFKCPIRFIFVVIEKAFPHRAELFELDPEARELAAAGRRRILGELAECLQTGVFVDRPSGKRRPIRSISLTAAEMGFAV